jgi:hypothetical protein
MRATATFLTAALCAASEGAFAQPIDIGSRLELLLDDYLIESLTGLSFQLHPPQPAEVALTFDKPWDGPNTDYVTVLKDGDRYRMYYACHPYGFSGDNQYTGYAESPDGIQWTEPTLGLVEFEGSTDNNLIWKGNTSHNLSPFIDANPNAPPEQRYKAVGGNPVLRPLASADGIHWRLLGDRAIVTGKEAAFDRYKVPMWGEEPNRERALCDSHNVAFWDAERGEYVCYFRAWVPRGDGQEGTIRTVFRTTSPDFLTWSDPEPLQFDVPPSVLDQFYTNGIRPYFRAPHIYIGLPMRLAPREGLSPANPRGGVGEGLLMTSRDGRSFHRYMEAFLRPGRDKLNWSKHSNMFALGVVPTGEGEMSVYYTQHYYAETAHLRRGVLRTDGFVSLNAPFAGGEFTTKPVVFAGRELVLNAATGAAGSICVEVQDAGGNPLDGRRLEDCAEFYGDEIAYTVRWNDGRDVSALAGQPIRLRFAMRDADLYSIQFR